VLHVVTFFLFLLGPIAAPSIHTSNTVDIPSAPELHRLRFYHTHTNERLEIVYRKGDAYVPEAIAELEHFLRDHRTGEEHHFDPRLFDVLSDLMASVGDPDGEIDVVCGYRTPWSNAFLRSRSRPWRSTVCTCRPWPSIYVCPASIRQNCGMRPWNSIAAAWATIAATISFMWMWGG